MSTAKSAPAWQAFNAGELSPLLEGRTDLSQYARGCKTLRNFIPTVQGPLERRGGTQFMGEAKDASVCWLIPFVSDVDAAYVLEFTDLAIRVWDRSGLILSAGIPLVIVTPYTEATLTRSDGTFAVTYAQSGDVMYLTCPGYKLAKLTRTSSTSWAYTTIDPDDGPWLDGNATESLTMYVSAATGSVTVTASAAVFTAAHVGALVRIEQKDIGGLRPWEPGERDVPLNSLRRSDGKTYEATDIPAGGTTWYQTGAVRPTHTTGKAWDGPGDTRTNGADNYEVGVEWQYRNAGYGIARITAYTNSTTVTATVLQEFPASLVGAGTPSYKWEFGAWGPHSEYPAHVAFFRERLTCAGKRHVWAGVAGDFESFADKAFGEVLADSGVTLLVIGAQANKITWIAPSNVLVVGTEGGEFTVGEVSTDSAFSPTNVKTEPRGEYGSNGTPPARVGGSVIFAQRGGRKLREFRYDFTSDTYESRDLTVLSQHLFTTSIKQMAYAGEPHAVVWLVTGGGVLPLLSGLIGLTYDLKQEVWCVHPHDLGGTIASNARSVAVLPGTQSQPLDEVWIAVRRTIAGASKIYIERISLPPNAATPEDRGLYGDCGLQQGFGVPVTTVSGLSHLNGETVTVRIDNAAHPDRVVAAGSITLERASMGSIAVGVRSPCIMETMKIETQGPQGTAQGKEKRFGQLVLRFFRTLGGKVGLSAAGLLDTLQFRRASDPMDSGPPLFTGDLAISCPGGFDSAGRIYYTNEQALPVTLVAIFPTLEVSDRAPGRSSS